MNTNRYQMPKNRIAHLLGGLALSFTLTTSIVPAQSAYPPAWLLAAKWWQ